MSPDQLTDSLHSGREMAGKGLDPGFDLRVTDDALNANPLRQVIPVDWAEIARALRTVWLRAISDPSGRWPPRRFQYAAGAGHDGHLERGMAALCGLERPGPEASGGADKRFRHGPSGRTTLSIAR